MQIIPLLLKELEEEVDTLKTYLEQVPADKFNWRPHEKSMSMQMLAVHLAEMPDLIVLAITQDELDFAKTPDEPSSVESTEELLDLLATSFQKAKKALAGAKEEELPLKWTMRNGEQVYWVFTKYEFVRHALAQIAHHRAQLGVYFRLLEIPVPLAYGPTADIQMG